MSEEQKQAVLDRDFTKLIDLGGNIYFLVKLSNTDGWSAQRAVGSMTDMTPDEYAAMMRAGGRSIEGNRSIKGKN
jgi:protocatechuate 4,5-dioxygenase alpha chain